MRKTITSSYFKTTAILLLSSIFLLGVILMFFASRYFKTEREKLLVSTIQSARTLLLKQVEETGYLNRSGLRETFEIIASTNDTLLFFVDDSGQVVLCSEGSKCQHQSYLISSETMNAVLYGGIFSELGTLSGIYGTTSYYTVGMPVITKDNAMIGALFASTPSTSLSLFLNDLFSMFIVSAGVMLFVSSLLSIVLAQRLATPLRNMSNAARSYGQGDFSVRVPTTGSEEVAQLALTFNNMAQTLQANDESRAAFIDNMAHELRTPMTSIKGFIDGILDGTIPQEQQARYLEIVSQEVGRLARLTRSMLDVTKLENGEVRQSPQVYDIWETLTSVVFGAEKRIAAKQIRIEGLAPQKTLVNADRDMVHQVVFNLVDNAVKFAGVGGVISLKVHEKQGRVYVAVRNTGEGIPKEDVPHIFDRFFKADKSRGLNTEGAGLGLYICKRLLSQGGGDIMVRSKLGEFTEFVFNLPAGSTDKPQRPAKSASTEEK